MLIKSLHHAAFRGQDARATVDFYTRMLGLKSIHAMGEDHVPSTGQYGPHIHIVFQREDGSCIAFFECLRDAGEPSGRNPQTSGWIQHSASRVNDEPTPPQTKADLQSKGVEAIGPVNRDDVLLSIYFFAPCGHRLELSVHTSTPAMDATSSSKRPPCWPSGTRRTTGPRGTRCGAPAAATSAGARSRPPNAGAALHQHMQHHELH